MTLRPRYRRFVLWTAHLALLIYITYSNLISVSQARVALGRLDFGIGLWLVHAGMVALLLVMFAQRMQLIRLRLGR